MASQIQEDTITKEQLRAEIQRLRVVELRGGLPLLSHVTTAEDAMNILTGGFCDNDTIFGIKGVFVSNRPLGPEEGTPGYPETPGISVLVVKCLVPLREIRKFEIEERGMGYRKWVIPSAWLDEFATVARSIE